ncbi:hypothetical protein FGRMN_392 [Fusarium graminum]|nr:hypothetical protein FGRMN_392 [Fusarium graminum]
MNPEFLREHSLGGKNMTAITKQAIEVIEYIKSRGCEVCFSNEDSFRTGLIPALDANATVIKSDTFVDNTLYQRLQKAFTKLKDEHRDNPDWHPRTNDMVQNLVYLSLYLLVYGRSRVFREEVVGVEDAVDKCSGKGEVIPKKPAGVPSGYDNRYHINYAARFLRPENPDDDNEANWTPKIDDWTPVDAGEVEDEVVIRDADGDLLYDTRKKAAWEEIREPI